MGNGRKNRGFQPSSVRRKGNAASRERSRVRLAAWSRQRPRGASGHGFLVPVNETGRGLRGELDLRMCPYTALHIEVPEQASQETKEAPDQNAAEEPQAAALSALTVSASYHPTTAVTVGQVRELLGGCFAPTTVQWALALPGIQIDVWLTRAHR